MSSVLIKRILSTIILIPISLFFIIKGSYYFNFFIFICLLIILFEWHTMTKGKKYYLYGLIFLILSFYSIYKLRNDFFGDYSLILFITLTCVATDIGGYVFGNIIKGPKLTKISPKKTYSGMFGGYLLSIISAYYFLNGTYADYRTELTSNIFIFVVMISSASQIGDIIISYFKRLSNIKDTGKIIPGHGGLLDRTDGMIFAFPFSYIILLTDFF